MLVHFRIFSSASNFIHQRLTLLYSLNRYASYINGLLLALLMTTACSPDKTANEQIASTIIALAKKRSAAVVNADTATLSAILSKDFRYINIYGESLSRKKYLENNAALGSDSSRWISQDIDSMTVQVLDNSAVVTFRVLDKFIYEGVPYENYCRSTFIYERQKDDWKCILGHTTKIDLD